MLHFLFLSIIFAYPSDQLDVRQSKTCKAQVGSPDWPSLESWQSLNTTLSGTLLRALPPASACYQYMSKSYDSVRCKQVTDSWFHSAFHSQDPVSVAYPNWQDDACLPPGIHNRSDSCELGSFPKYVVNASSSDHVEEAVKFAAKTNVRLVVKGSGHDLLGRSTGPSSLSIWTSGLKGLTYHPAFSSSCSRLKGVPAVTAYAGQNMGDVYHEVAEYNMTFVGAADPDVGLGGYLTGGGHSPLGSKYGMAVDNVLELSLVTPTGTTITASPCQNTDMFWAMRGGGGATFGVLVNATFRAYSMPPLTFVKFAFNSTEEEATANSNAHFYSAAAYLHTQLPALAEAGLSGYFSIAPLSDQDLSSPMTFAFLTYVLSSAPEDLLNALQPIMARLNATTGLTTSIVTGSFPSFELFRSNFMGAAAVGTNGVTASRLWDNAAVWKEADLVNTLSQFSQQLLVGTFVSGNGVQRVSANDSALNPAWRKTILHMMTTVKFPFKSTKVEIASATAMADNLSAVLRAQAPNMGCYINEANVHEQQYQTAFWGAHYERLLRIKKQVDPQSVFWCPVCVGAEDWTLGNDGKLCKYEHAMEDGRVDK